MKNKILTSLMNDFQEQAFKYNEVPELAKTSINVLEVFAEELTSLEDENQELKNELNKLKGETVSPEINEQTSKNHNHSSTKQRKSKNKKPKKGGSKKANVKIDRTENLTIDLKDLSFDAQRSGTKKTIIQDIKIITDNIEFNRQMYYSKSENKTYIAPLPPGYEGEYGPNIKTWVKTLYSAAQMTIGNIAWVFKTAGSIISASTVSRILTKNNEELHDKKIEIVKAGLKSTAHQNLDDTFSRENGSNCYVNVLTNQYYAAFFTLRSKRRLSVIEMLSIDGISFIFDDLAFSLMNAMKLPQQHIDYLKNKTSSLLYLRTNVDNLLLKLFPDPKKHKKYRKIILEATSISAYRKSDYAISHLIVDDAPQFKLITEHLGLCWIHEGRHYKKLIPFFEYHKKLLNKFIDEFWDYYELLKKYKEHPSKEKIIQLETKFDELFSQITGYDTLDKQITRTYAKKKLLLLVLYYPCIPIHNNNAELVARFQARVRDVHYHTMSAAGTKIKDTLATITMTAKKLAVNVFDYLFDMITKSYEMISLPELIKLKSEFDMINSNVELYPN